MKLSCPDCAAKYTVADERLDGRRVRVRCRRCGAAFAVEPATRRESSVLFSLAMLTRERDVPPPEAASTTSVDDIVRLGTGGPFSPWLAPPVVEAVEAEAPASGGWSVARRIAVGIVGLGALTLVVAVVASSSRGAARPERVAAAVVATGPTAETGLPPRVEDVAPATTPVATSATVAVRTVASSPRSPARRTPEAVTPAAPPTAIAPPTPKCCAGEDETTCHMRLAVGARCDAPTNAASPASAPPFDRVAATRALAVDVAGCRRDDGPTGRGHVKVTFQPSGSASHVEVDPPFAGTASGACILQRFRSVTVPAFAGGPLTVGRSLVVSP